MHFAEQYEEKFGHPIPNDGRSYSCMNCGGSCNMYATGHVDLTAWPQKYLCSPPAPPTTKKVEVKLEANRHYIAQAPPEEVKAEEIPGTVWVLCEGADYEGEVVVGVFSTLDLAKKQVPAEYEIHDVGYWRYHGCYYSAEEHEVQR